MSTSSARYVSTRGQAPETDFADALLRGIAPDGGLYMPAAWPTLSPSAWDATADYKSIALAAVAPFIGDALPAGALDRALDRLAAGFAHPAVTPLVELERGLFVLELFHGPTAAFKDLAMQLVAALTDEALAASGERLTILTATSGDTGAAAVRAFAGAQSVDLVVLHPLDRVSPVQRKQMTTVQADNVLNLAVRGDFDDCQRLVKGLLAEESLRERGRLSSVNSINWARLAGQIPYYVSATAQLGGPATFVVPTGNFGDAFAAAFQLVASLDTSLTEIVALSLRVSLTAVFIATAIGLPLGAAMALFRFPGRMIILVTLNAFMGLPPVVVGLIVYLLLSRAGPFGVLGLLFTPTAMIIAQVILVIPIIASLARQVVEDLWAEYEEQLRSLGAGPRQALITLLWDGRFSLITSVLAGFGRASAEVGAVMIVGGNIDHTTRVMTTAIALEVSKGDLALALGLGLILLMLSTCVNGAAFLIKEAAQRRHA